MSSDSRPVPAVAVAGPDAPGHRSSDNTSPLLADRLLNKCEKEQTGFDVQIGDGMDIGIMGENGQSNMEIVLLTDPVSLM